MLPLPDLGPVYTFSLFPKLKISDIVSLLSCVFGLSLMIDGLNNAFYVLHVKYESIVLLSSKKIGDCT